MPHNLVMDFWQVDYDAVLESPAFRYVTMDSDLVYRQFMPCEAWTCHGSTMERMGYEVPTRADLTEHLEVTLIYRAGYDHMQARANRMRTDAIIALEQEFEVGFCEWGD